MVQKAIDVSEYFAVGAVAEATMETKARMEI